MSAEQKPVPWYVIEHDTLLAEYKAMPGYQLFRVETLDWPHPKLSDIYRCAKMEKEQPEIWALAKEEALFPKSKWDSDYRSPMNYYAGFFERWFRMKNGLEYTHSAAYALITPTLREWAHPDFCEDELAPLRRFLDPYPMVMPYIDDMPNGDAHQVTMS